MTREERNQMRVDEFAETLDIALTRQIAAMNDVVESAVDSDLSESGNEPEIEGNKVLFACTFFVLGEEIRGDAVAPRWIYERALRGKGYFLAWNKVGLRRTK